MDALIVTQGRRFEVGYDVTIHTTVFAMGAVIDDGGAGAILPPYRVEVDEPLLRATDHEIGYALIGDPDVALRDRTVAHPLTVTIIADGYREATTTVIVPAAPVLPIVAPVALRRQPVRLTGRVLVLATGLPVADAAITIQGPPLPAPDAALLLGQPLARDLTPAASLQGHAVTPVGGPVPIKAAAAAAAAGDTQLFLDDRQNLATGQLLRFGPPERAHWAEIAQVPATPGVVRLTAPLARTVRLNDAVAPFNLGAAVGPAAAPSGAAFAGEGVLILNASPNGQVLAVTDPPAAVAYHSMGASSGPTGEYAIDGLSRLARPVLSVAAAGFTAQTRPWPLPRLSPAATLDWRMTP